ncbi:ATP-binding domain-containing protein [Rhizobium laguerreae]|uniref:NERD domain-containing protein n=1 Tax=Rhizobium laguerreae TaxID=1076926 RepID=UPI001C909CC1|nr:NERD domain-containing protein [Rhizobium laguerreae]MBY3476166.1 ATP-binding domain-containing protein [Rhizobium laguerreae]MBY3521856.1 ATP-binding domain-containing protein [Rhizobium laguerreae]
MLQQFLERLEPQWAASDDWIVVIANAYWNGTEIDAVCILPSAILVADFKSHGGKLTGTENGPWQADGILVKGGSKANPFQQLRDNKFSVLNWLTSRTLLPGRNLGHISASAMFSGRIVDELELPSKVRSWLYPTDIDTCTTLLKSLGSPELRIERKEAQEIVRRLGVPIIEWTSTRPFIRSIESSFVKPEHLPSATPHQQEALLALCSCVSSNEMVSFSVLGMTSTGKSRVLALAVEEIKRTGKKVIVLEPNRRLADAAEVESTSIYSYLYTGSTDEEEDQDAEAEEKKLKVIPLRPCDDPEDCVYLLDDAHLLGNSRFNTPDGKQYGSGHLLVDFFDFAEIGKSQRKVVFFGDHYQMQRSADEESALLGEFQKRRGFRHQFLELNQVIDTTGGSARLANAERLVNAIRSKRFSELNLSMDDGFRQSDKHGAAVEMLEHFRSDPLSAWYLAETHAKTNALTLWVRERLHGRKLLASVEPGDMLEIYVRPDVRDPLEPGIYRQIDGRHKVVRVGERVGYCQGLTWATKNPVRFHSIACSVGNLNEAKITLLEEFLTAEKPELEKETAVAESVWRREIEKDRRQALKEGQQEVLAPKPQPPDFVYARYGYASTVHHAQGMSQPICYINCDHAAGRHSEGYFRWLYSALTVGERELVLINFTEIHPFDSATWNASAVTVAKDIAVGAGWSFEPNGIAAERDLQRALPHGLDQSKDISRSAAIWLRITHAVESVGWRVGKADCYPHQEQYGLVGPNGEQCKLRVSYNGRNFVTAMHVDDPAFWPLLTEAAAGCLQTNSHTPEADDLLRSIRSRYSRKGWRLVSHTETPYRLTVTLARNTDERVVIEVNFDKQGLVSSLRPRQVSDLGLLEEIKRMLL